MEIRSADAVSLQAIVSGIPERTPEQHVGRYESQEQGHGVYLVAWDRGAPVGHVMLEWLGGPSAMSLR